MRPVVFKALALGLAYWLLLFALAVGELGLPFADRTLLLPLTVVLGLPVLGLAALYLTRRALAEGSKLARIDDLTGIGNRRALLADWAEEGRATRSAAGLVLLDVDDLKHLNDACGHEAGDELLKNLARRLEPWGRAYRIGGDEFALILDNAGDVSLAPPRQAIEPVTTFFPSCGHHHVVRVSFGFTAWSARESLGDVLRRADEALRRSKRSAARARNRIAV